MERTIRARHLGFLPIFQADSRDRNRDQCKKQRRVERPRAPLSHRQAICGPKPRKPRNREKIDPFSFYQNEKEET